MEENVRDILLSAEFKEYYDTLDGKTQEKYDYVARIIETQRVVSSKFVKHLEQTEFYEARISVSSDEYRTIIFAIDSRSFMECKRVLFLNSFLKKGTKQYKGEINLARNILKRYMED